MHVTTYETLNNRGGQLVFLLKSLFSQFIQYIEKELVIELVKMNGRILTLAFNEKNLKKVYDLLLKGELEELSICDKYENDDDDPYVDDTPKTIHYPQYFTLGISCNYAATYPPHFTKNFLFPNEFNLALSERLFNNYIPNVIQTSFVKLFENTISTLMGVTGFITNETISGSAHMISTFENYHKLNTDLRPGYIEHVKGYFWMNYLSDKHISKLGGREYVLANAPCEVRELQHPGMILQLTDDINVYSDNKLRALREFLSPLFPPLTDLPLQYEEGYLHRLIE